MGNVHLSCFLAAIEHNKLKIYNIDKRNHISKRTESKMCDIRIFTTDPFLNIFCLR